MTTLILILLPLVAATALAWTTRLIIRLITTDGYGRRPAPRSHHDEERRHDPVLVR